MKKSIVFFLSLLLAFSALNTKAANDPGKNTPLPDEGMWLPMLIERLNIEDMQKMGLKLTAEEIYSVNQASLKDAIVIFGGGCTGEMISSQGLLLTNHHCGYGQIQAHSTTEHDYLKNGFWAYSKDQELPNPDLSVKFLKYMKDVTAEVSKGLNDDMSTHDRDSIIGMRFKAIEEEATKGNHYMAQVKSFFAGNEFYLFVYEVFEDVRFVGAPPSSIGKFGADTDNWMWPRHTGDFSLFRVYMSPDGKPAKYSKDNVPYEPKKYLPVSISGIEKGDFAMIMGNPGSTERYLTSYGINSALKYKNPTIVDIRTKKLEIMKNEMDADDAVRIMYASKYARTANYWKYFQGQSRGLKRLKVYDKKKNLEQEFAAWLKKDNENIRKYGNVLADFEDAYKTLDQYTVANQYFFEAIYRGAEIVSLANQYRGFYTALTAEEPDEEYIGLYANYLKSNLDKHFKDYYLPIDKTMLAEMLKMYYENLDPKFYPEILVKLHKKFKGDFDAISEYVFKNSMFDNKDDIGFFLDDPNPKVLSKDMGYIIATEFIAMYIDWGKQTAAANEKLEKANRLFIQGLRKMKKDKKFYPDANFTMRLTYGTVEDYYPEDAVHFNYYTTLEGVMEKEDPTTDEFIVFDKLKELYKKKDYGRYGYTNEKGEKVMNVCFLTTHDITGGNSGSPVIDGEGNLIGLAFDGNWEAMSGDIAFEPKLQRTINVDIRYVLFVIDKFAGAQNIIDELTIVEPKKQEEKAETTEAVEEAVLEETR